MYSKSIQQSACKTKCIARSLRSRSASSLKSVTRRSMLHMPRLHVPPHVSHGDGGCGEASDLKRTFRRLEVQERRRRLCQRPVHERSQRGRVRPALNTLQVHHEDSLGRIVAESTRGADESQEFAFVCLASPCAIQRVARLCLEGRLVQLWLTGPHRKSHRGRRHMSGWLLAAQEQQQETQDAERSKPHLHRRLHQNSRRYKHERAG